MEKHVKRIVDFVRNRPDFEFKNIADSYNYAVGDTFSLSVDGSRNLTNNHMGATIIDGILQAGLNYKNVVKPRVDKFKDEYRNLRTTTDFYNLIQEKDVSVLINMKGQKVDRIINLTKLLKNEKIETEDDFHDWLTNPDNILALSNLKGIKDKTIDYFKILTGHKNTVAIDVHLINFIKLCCNDLDNVSYDFAKELLIRAAKELKVEPATFDHSIWNYMSNQKRDNSNINKKVDDGKTWSFETMWNGYCPESLAKGKTVRMRLNQMDFFESEETGLQIAIVMSGVQAAILNFRGSGKFRSTPKYGDEIENGELLSPQTIDRPPFNNGEMFEDGKAIEEYIKKIK